MKLCCFCLLSASVPVVMWSIARASSCQAKMRLLQTKRTPASLAWIIPTKQTHKFAGSPRNRWPLFFSSSVQLPQNRIHCHSFLSQQHCQFATNSDQEETATSSGGIFAGSEVTFKSMGVQSPVLLKRLEKLGLSRPTAVQASTFETLSSTPRIDLTIGAETGSGKTLAYLLPLLDDILRRKKENKLGYIYARAMILVPNKELAQQVARMAVGLSGGEDSLVLGRGFDEENVPREDCKEEDMVRLAIMPGGLSEPTDFPPFRNAIQGKELPVDLVISTPAAVGPLGLSPKNINMFADIATLVLDEADMLLDGGYIRPLEQVLLGFRRADKLDDMHQVPRTQHVFVAATLPDMGLRSVDSYLQRKFPNANRFTLDGMHNARHYGLSQPTLWIEDETKKSRLNHLMGLLKQSFSEGGLQGQKVMVFLNSVEDVESVSNALEQNGIDSLPYHAKMSLQERTENLKRFRQYESDSMTQRKEAVSILVCTDLAARGVDIPGVHAIVQLQFAGNVVAHLHRMGRCGRAGQRTGRGIVFYNQQEAELVRVVQEAEQQQEKMALKGQDVMEFDENGSPTKQGTVKKAFSRKRGFTKKLKKERRNTQADGDY